MPLPILPPYLIPPPALASPMPALYPLFGETCDASNRLGGVHIGCVSPCYTGTVRLVGGCHSFSSFAEFGSGPGYAAKSVGQFHFTPSRSTLPAIYVTVYASLQTRLQTLCTSPTVSHVSYVGDVKVCVLFSSFMIASGTQGHRLAHHGCDSSRSRPEPNGNWVHPFPHWAF